MRYLEDHDGTATIGDICSAADVCSEQSARKAIYTLADKGLIYRSDLGKQGSKETYTMRASRQSEGSEPDE